MLFAAAFAEANFSGEIGADSLLWVAAALLVAARPARDALQVAHRHLRDPD
jgi:hypothetical protein